MNNIPMEHGTGCDQSNNYIINSDNVMFNYPPTSQLQEDVIDIIMIMKHVLYRLKFRENRNVFPSSRMDTVITALELESSELHE